MNTWIPATTQPPVKGIYDVTVNCGKTTLSVYYDGSRWILDCTEIAGFGSQITDFWKHTGEKAMSSKRIDAGFFSQEHVNTLMGMTGMHDARDYIQGVVEQYTRDHPRVNKENLRKVSAILQRARTPQQLAYSVQNFILAHPSEGLRVVK